MGAAEAAAAAGIAKATTSLDIEEEVLDTADTVDTEVVFTCTTTTITPMVSDMRVPAQLASSSSSASLAV